MNPRAVHAVYTVDLQSGRPTNAAGAILAHSLLTLVLWTLIVWQHDTNSDTRLFTRNKETMTQSVT
jgi:hypothetical protein